MQSYDGMIVGEHSRDTDLDVSSCFHLTFHTSLISGGLPCFASIALPQVNPVRAKELTNIRSAGKDDNVKLSPPRLVSALQPFAS